MFIVFKLFYTCVSRNDNKTVISHTLDHCGLMNISAFLHTITALVQRIHTHLFFTIESGFVF